MKKKFVVSADYCITVDRVPKSLYTEIANNQAQWDQWSGLGFLNTNAPMDLISNSVIGTVDYIESYQFLTIDTSLYPGSFKERLLLELPNLDHSVGGLLISTDNFQGLNFIQEKFSKKIDCLHIDPPYNTATSGFLYKNQYQHSSWLTLMQQTSARIQRLLSEDGVFQCHIDENEYENLFLMLNDVGVPNSGSVIWDKKNPMLGRKGVATQHEYILWRSAENGPVYLKGDSVLKIIQKAAGFISALGGVNYESRQAFSKWINAQNDLTGGEKAYRFIEDDGRVYRGVAMGAPEPRTDPKFFIPLVHPITGIVCPIPPNGWSRTPDTINDLIQRKEILWGSDHNSQPQKKVFLNIESKRQLSSVIQDASSGKKYMDALGLAFPYCHPVSLYEQLFGAVKNGREGIFCDYFAGSGTTAHAVVSLNRSDNGNRKYILMEQGSYFDDVIKKRVQKIIYSANWKDGKPTAPETGISHAFKVIKLESYEDTLNNLELRRTTEQGD